MRNITSAVILLAILSPTTALAYGKYCYSSYSSSSSSSYKASTSNDDRP